MRNVNKILTLPVMYAKGCMLPQETQAEEAMLVYSS